MKYLAWAGIFLVARLAEVSFLPQFFGSYSPGLSHLALASAFALLPIRAAFLAALGWGLVIDFTVPLGEAVSAVTVAFALFVIVRVCLSIVPWDEPLRRIAGLGAGLAFFPAAWWIGVAATRVIFGAPLPTPTFGDIASPVFAAAAIFAFAWLAVFSLFVFYKHRSSAGAQLKLL